MQDKYETGAIRSLEADGKMQPVEEPANSSDDLFLWQSIAMALHSRSRAGSGAIGRFNNTGIYFATS